MGLPEGEEEAVEVEGGRTSACEEDIQTAGLILILVKVMDGGMK